MQLQLRGYEGKSLVMRTNIYSQVDYALRKDPPKGQCPFGLCHRQTLG